MEIPRFTIETSSRIINSSESGKNQTRIFLLYFVQAERKKGVRVSKQASICVFYIEFWCCPCRLPFPTFFSLFYDPPSCFCFLQKKILMRSEQTLIEKSSQRKCVRFEPEWWMNYFSPLLFFVCQGNRSKSTNTQIQEKKQKKEIYKRTKRCVAQQDGKSIKFHE